MLFFFYYDGMWVRTGMMLLFFYLMMLEAAEFQLNYRVVEIAIPNMFEISQLCALMLEILFFLMLIHIYTLQ